METLILRPNALGDEWNLQSSPNNGESNYEDVNDVTPDELSSYVYNGGAAYIRDLHNIQMPSGGSTITKITVYARGRGYEPVTQPSLKIAIKSGTGDTAPDTVTEDEKTVTTSWANYSKEWTTNPATSVPWTWDEIANLQIGVALRDCRVGFFFVTECTQLYVAVEYYPRSILAQRNQIDIIIKNPDGETLAYTPNAACSYDYRVNELGILRFTLPSDSDAKAYLVYPNEAWLYIDGKFKDAFKIMRTGRER